MGTKIKAFRINSFPVSIEKFDWSRRNCRKYSDTAFKALHYMVNVHCIRTPVFRGWKIGIENIRRIKSKAECTRLSVYVCTSLLAKNVNFEFFLNQTVALHAMRCESCWLCFLRLRLLEMEVYLFTGEILFKMLIEWQQTIVSKELSIRFPHLFIYSLISILHWHLEFVPALEPSCGTKQNETKNPLDRYATSGNPSSSTPLFELRNLISGVGYNVFLIAQNAKGRSNSTVRQVFTLNNPEKQTDTSSLLASTPSLANLKIILPFLLFGCACTIALTAIIVIFIVRKRANRSNSSNSTNDVLGDQSTGGSNDRSETVSYALSTQRTLQSSHEVARDLCADSNESMEKNPDIIPQGNDFLSHNYLILVSRFHYFRSSVFKGASRISVEQSFFCRGKSKKSKVNYRFS